MLEQVASEFRPIFAESGLSCSLDLPPKLHYSCCLLYTSSCRFLQIVDKVGPGFCPEFMRKSGIGVAADQTNAMLATSKEVISLHRTPALRFRPVSYTHLDVYKRQPFGFTKDSMEA